MKTPSLGPFLTGRPPDTGGSSPRHLQRTGGQEKVPTQTPSRNGGTRGSRGPPPPTWVGETFGSSHPIGV